jgi:hypothetical protein
MSFSGCVRGAWKNLQKNLYAALILEIFGLDYKALLIQVIGRLSVPSSVSKLDLRGGTFTKFSVTLAALPSMLISGSVFFTVVLLSSDLFASCFFQLRKFVQSLRKVSTVRRRKVGSAL